MISKALILPTGSLFIEVADIVASEVGNKVVKIDSDAGPVGLKPTELNFADSANSDHY